MRKFTLIGSTITGIVIGAVLLNATPSFADWPVIDWTSIGKEMQQISILNNILTTFQSVQNAINSLLGPKGPIASVLGDNTFGTVQQLLQEGFTQNANYSKAQIGAQENIADASNEAMAQFDLQMRDAQIRDQQTASPAQCYSLDGGVSTTAAAVQGFDVGWRIGQIHDMRAEAQPSMPSYYGEAQGIASMEAEHVNNYCDQNDAAAGLCTQAKLSLIDADQQYSSLFGSGTYADQQAVNTAKDYATNLIEPVAPAALRGDQLSSLAGQNAALLRRSFNARMSLAQSIVDNDIGMQSPSVPLTNEQQEYLTERGLPQQQTGSWLQVLQIEAQRRMGDVNWNAMLQAMPPASVEREIATELALSTYLEFEVYKTELEHTTVSAAQLAQTTEHDFAPAAPMPVPSIAAN